VYHSIMVNDQTARRRELEQAGREQLQRLQLSRLNQLLEQILPGNQFYAEKLSGINLPLESLDQLSSLPMTSKQELVTGNPDSDHAANLTFPLDQYQRVHRTSGTRGRPMIVLDTDQDWQWWLDTWQFVLDVADVVHAVPDRERVEVGQVRGNDADLRGERERWKPKRLGHSDASGLRDQDLFRLLDIRAALEELRASRNPLARLFPFKVQELFLIYDDGRLISHSTLHGSRTVDSEIVSSMLTAIGDFIKDSFRADDKGSLENLKYGNINLYVQRREPLYLAGVISGTAPDDFGVVMKLKVRVGLM